MASMDCSSSEVRPTARYVRQRPSKLHEPATTTGPTSVSITNPAPPFDLQAASCQLSNTSPFSSHAPAYTGPPTKSGSRPTRLRYPAVAT